MNKVPVLVISGFAGAGKTSLSNHLRAGLAGKKVAWILADLGRGEIDSALCETATPGIVHCKSREHLCMELRKVGRAKEWDHLIIESTGASEPLPVAECLALDDGRGTPVSRYCQVDAMITVVSAESFLSDYASIETLEGRGLATSSSDARVLVEALVPQVELADVLVVNKADLAGEEQLADIEAMLRAMNPRARVVRAEHGNGPLDGIAGAGLFDFNAWRELLGTARYPETPGAAAQGGFDTGHYRRFRPFHPGRFEDLVHGDWSGVIRSRGTFWTADRPDSAGEWWQAARVVRHRTTGSFWAATPEAEWEISDERKARIKSVWQEPFGDRRQDLAFVVKGLERGELERRLDGCLLTDEEMALGPAGWRAFASEQGHHAHPEEEGHPHEHTHRVPFRGHTPEGGHHMQ